MMTDNSIALQTKQLVIGYDAQPLMSIPDINLWPGKVTAMIGQNGIGKSTFLKTITREIKPVRGDIFIEGKNIRDLSQRQLATKLSVVTTDRDISKGLLVREIVGMGRHPHTGLLGRFSKNDLDSVEKAINETGILDLSESLFGQLSDGEKQKVLIARALAQDAPVMILDEPFSFLDTGARIDILNLLKKLATTSSTAILFSTHDVAQALRMADEIWAITSKREFVCGVPQRIIASSIMNELFDTETVRFDSAQNDFVARDKK